MKNPNVWNWVIDLLVVAILTAASVLLLPLVSAWGAALSLKFGRAWFAVHSIVFGDILPHVMVGGFLGLASAWLMRHRKLWLAMLPALLICLFYALYSSFGPYPYPWGQSRRDVVLVGNWLLLLAVSFGCARVVLGRRDSNTSLRATTAASGS